ncbi:hypothetical protein L53_13005 [Hyphomonas sp. L-53-1-40]|uniref:ImmA/IrrE family metallo-endopeptidase n=1 Tax=Hyphomonas sp. L-53-1-40 TaxID=1207058 RepID=UPI000458FAAF|nr:ImmA/IrrE family metallo-endopeptidase [Hyphomonas sp. L-53-1-40]KCZ62155.1 hypothetical protein L53_13005 [Hyphomonas sp. L-53-1-40]
MMLSDPSTFAPDWFSHPGITINAVLQRRELDINDFSDLASWNQKRTRDLLQGQLKIDADIASTLSKHIGSSPAFWLQRQKDFDSDLQRCANQIKEQQADAFLSNLPIKEMKKHGWLPTASNDLSSILQFFDISGIDDWSAKYEAKEKAVAFRQSPTYSSEPNSTLVWLRQAERAATLVRCGSWDKDKFVSNLTAMRAFAKMKDPAAFLPKLIKLCAECGVAVVFVRAPKGCRASGATQFINADKAMIVLSFRYLSDDHFWFTFFHEAAHLILHDKRALFIEDGSEVTGQEEQEANDFSRNVLVPTQYVPEMESLPSNFRSIVRFALKIGISPGIVVGQLQHAGCLRPNQLNSLKRRFNWDQLALAF